MEVNVIQPSPVEIAKALRRANAPTRDLPEVDVRSVCIVSIHQGFFARETAEWIDAQRSRGVSVVFHQEEPSHSHKSPTIEKYLNCSEARNNARRIALERCPKEIEWLMFIDHDVVPPLNAIDHFLHGEFEIQGGWYHQKKLVAGHVRWVAGQWVDDNVLDVWKRARTESFIESHVLPAGCCFLSREVSAMIPFEHGTDRVFTDSQLGRAGVLGECGIFGNRVAEHGLKIMMNPGVVCRHV